MHPRTPTWLVHLRSSMPIGRTVASTIAHEHCTTLLNHHHLRHWSPRWKPISPPKPVNSIDQSASGAVQRSVGRSVGCSQENTAVPVPHSRIQVEREKARSELEDTTLLFVNTVGPLSIPVAFLPESSSVDDFELRVERPSTRLEQSSASRGGRVCRPNPPDCTHLGTRGRRPCYTRRTGKPTVTLGTREIDVRGSGAGSALTPVSSFDPTIRGSDSHAAHA